MLVPVEIILRKGGKQKHNLRLYNGVYWRLTARTSRGGIRVHAG